VVCFPGTFLRRSGFGRSVDILQEVAIVLENGPDMLLSQCSSGLTRDRNCSFHQVGDDGPLVSWWVI
jgi:hypothetical protein